MDENTNVVVEETEETAMVPETVQDDQNSTGKLGLAILGVGAAAIVGGCVALGKKIKKGKQAKEEKPEEPKETKEVTRGDKLSFKERVLGYKYNKVEKSEETPATEAE